MAKNVRDYVEFIQAKQAPGTPHDDKFRLYGKKVGSTVRLYMILDDGVVAPVAGRPVSVSKTAAYTLTVDDVICLADATTAAFSVTLPAVADATGWVFTVKKVDSSVNAVTLDADGSETIDGSANYSLAQQFDSVTVYCDGTEWHIIGEVVRS